MRLPTLPRLPVTAERVVPIVVPLIISALGLLLLVQPSLSAALRASADLGRLESRVTSLRRLVTPGTEAPDEDAAVMAEFERRVPATDRTPELVEMLARLALDPPDTARARGLVIDTSPRVWPDAKPASSGPQLGGPQPQPVLLDPRWRLFPEGLAYTPITVSLDCSYDRLGLLLWRLRDLPTLVEVRRLEVARALPLLKVKLVLFALQRTGQPLVSPVNMRHAGVVPYVASSAVDALSPVRLTGPAGRPGIDGGASWQ